MACRLLQLSLLTHVVAKTLMLDVEMMMYTY